MSKRRSELVAIIFIGKEAEISSRGKRKAAAAKLGRAGGQFSKEWMESQGSSPLSALPEAQACIFISASKCPCRPSTAWNFASAAAGRQ